MNKNWPNQVCRKAVVVKIIVTEDLAGSGTEDDVYRIIHQYWTLDGIWLASGPPPIMDARTISPFTLYPKGGQDDG